MKTYSWYASTHNLTIEETCEHFESDEGCCWYRKSKGSYVIFYNDRIENKGRVRWTIAHEIGHFILKHNEITNKTIFNRNSLTSDEYDVFEKEANCFARNLLAPQSLMYELRPTNPNVVSDIFNISLEAAKNILDFFNNGLKKE
ncbi:ImmA/IrrE family metallo-endopeptidase [Bacillus pumilus]|nr:ImmA/IrrE family metallo-endopeptidase [Bacillus pumilus]